MRRALFGMPSDQFSQPTTHPQRDCACVLENSNATSANVLHTEALTCQKKKRK
jgi:hypothetical protein